EQQLKEKPDLPDDVKKSYRDTRGFFRDDDDTFNSTLDKYVTPESSGAAFSWDSALNQNQKTSAQPGHETPDRAAGAWNNYRLPSFPTFEKSIVWPAAEKTKGSAGNITPEKPVVNVDVYPSSESGVSRNLFTDIERHRDNSADFLLYQPEVSLPLSPAPEPVSPAGLSDEEGGSYWETLLQKLDIADKAPPPRQLNDNRKFEYRFEIYGAPGQDERGIAEEVGAMTKSNPAFTGDSSMLDGGQIW
ncbi:hypothetical protein SR86_24320, partial [Enterobacter hormaechei subsp. xiangfangensis]